MALPTVGWAFLHQVIMKTVPHRCAPKVNTTWAMPQLRLLFMWPEAVSSWQSKPEHISYTEASPDVAKHIPISSDKEERYLWGCKRWVLVLSWHSLHLFLIHFVMPAHRVVPSIWKESLLSVKLDWKLPCRPWVHYGPSCLISDLTDREVHHHHKQRLSYSHLRRFFFFWQCSP